ncbi:MAG: PDZ domain-containing protein [Fuerstiella sp.]
MNLKFTYSLAALLLAVSPMTALRADADEPKDTKVEKTTTSEPKSQSVSVSVKSSSVSNGEGEDVKTEITGKMIIVGPDGKKTEINLGDKLPEGIELPEGIKMHFSGKDGDKSSVMMWNGLSKGPRYMIGVICEPADEVLRAHMELGDVGLVVTSISDEMPAAKAGIAQGDILLSIGDKKLTKVDDLVTAVTKSEGKPLEFYVLKKGKKSAVSVTPKEQTDEDAMKAFAFEVDDDVIVELKNLENSGSLTDKNIVFRRFGPGLRVENGKPFEIHAESIEALKKAAAEAAGTAKQPAKVHAELARRRSSQLQEEVERLQQRLNALEKQMQSLNKTADGEKE